MTFPSQIFLLSITSSLFILVVTVESTITVLTKSPTSAVSPPVKVKFIPIVFNSSINSFVPLIIAVKTSEGINLLLRPIVEDTNMFPTAPTHNKSSRFMTSASCAIPFQTDKSPVLFQYI